MNKIIPNGWKSYSIKEIGTVITGSTPPKKYPVNYGGDLPWIKPPDLDNEMFVFNSSETISEIGREKVRLLPKGTVLVSCIGNIGKIAIAGEVLCTNQQINSIIPNEKIVDSIFLYFTIRRMQPYLQKMASKAVVPLLNKTDFSKIIINLPPLPTQKKIVAILEKAEKLKGWRREADELTDELLKSTFLEMFGDPVKNQKEWEKIKLMNCIEFITSGSRGWGKYYTNEGERFIRIQNVINGELDFTDVQYVKPPKNKESIRTKVKEDDLVLSITADLGRTAVVDNKTASDGAYINQHLALIRLNKKIVNPIFVSYYLISEGGKRQFEFLDQKGVKSGLNFNSVKSLDLFLPPLELQNEFAIFSEKIKQIQQYQKQRKHQIDYLFNSLMQKAFKGELKC